MFIEDLADVPPGNTVIFSAHGVSQAVRAEAVARGLQVFDATCPLVTKVHLEVARMREQGRDIVMIGHKGHPEVEGTMGQAKDGIHLAETVADVDALQVANPELLAYVTQTTLSMDDAAAIVDALRKRFPAIVGPKKDDICYATQNRQDAVKFMAPGGRGLCGWLAQQLELQPAQEVAELRGVPAYLVDNADGIDPAWIEGKRRIGVTAGASAPEVLVEAVIERLKRLGGASVRPLEGVPEDHLSPAQGTAARATQSEGALARISHLGATAVIEMLAWRPSEAPASSS